MSDIWADPSLYGRMEKADPVVRDALLYAWRVRDEALAEVDRLRAELDQICAEHGASSRQEAAKVTEKRCWCGGEVGPRTPGDEQGLGCLAVIEHRWRESGMS